jgi:predicted nucleotidyltransferase
MGYVSSGDGFLFENILAGLLFMWYITAMKQPLIIAFGSQVTEKSTEKSDFDFAILTDKSLSLSDRTNYIEHISKTNKINEDKIDLVDLSTALPILKFEIAQKGKLIEGAYEDFIRFKVRAFKEYVDTAKFRRLREQMIMKNYA